MVLSGNFFLIRALLKLRSSRAQSLNIVDLQGKEQLYLFSE